MIEPSIKQFVAAKYEKWVSLCIEYLCKALAISFAWWLRRFVAAFHSSIRGGEMFASGFVRYVARSELLASQLPADRDG
jgi:hypothetical protein